MIAIAKAPERLVDGSPEWAAEILSLWADREVLLAEEVVEWARAHPESSLYSRLEWDDDKAAGAWRIHQARNLINRVMVYVENKPHQEVHLAIHLSPDGNGYRRTADAIQDRPDEVMREEATRLLRALNRAIQFPCLREVRAVVTCRDRVMKMLE